jgi:CRISPR/Cas system CMR subunit Cmr6 (Cas7 group RAMP superfamily)
MPEVLRAAGPLGQVIDVRLRFGPDANALVLLRRVAFFDGKGLADEGKRALLRWAAATGSGQSAELVAAVGRRREAMLRALAPQHVRRLTARAEWRLAVGLGDKANAHEIGLSLHGTYGWPVIPCSALKGLTAAWAVASEVPAGDVRRVLGTPRADVPPPPRDSEEPRTRRGNVCFLDSLPASGGVRVVPDVMTPHVKPYYDGVNSGEADVPPAEYHNPVPIMFLTVTGTFAVDLYGPVARDVDLAADWLAKAGDELGAGAKTAAGYGYLEVSS